MRLLLALASLLAPALLAATAQPVATAAVVRCQPGTDVTAALAAAAGGPGRHVVLSAEPRDATCMLSRPVAIRPGLNLAGENAPTLKLTASATAFSGDARSSGFRIARLTVDGSGVAGGPAIRLAGSHDGRIEGVRLLRPANGVVLLDGANGIVIKDLTVLGSRAHGVTMKASFGNTVDGATLEGQAGFGVILTDGSHGNHLTRLRTDHGGLELVGMTYQTHGNTLTDSVARHTGDNCYSITGSGNTLRDLTGENCAGNGIAFYGSGNTLDGGLFRNNNQQFQKRNAWHGGVAFLQGFGGVAQHNTVTGVTLDDDQDGRTQQVGVLVQRAGYQAWRPGLRVKAGQYAVSGLDLYVARDAGVTGPAPPRGPGPQFDGAIHWDHANRFQGTVQPDFNSASVTVGRAAKAAYEDRSEARDNRHLIEKIAPATR